MQFLQNLYLTESQLYLILGYDWAVRLSNNKVQAMHYRKLGQTDTKVSLIGLGTMTWGEQNSEQDAFAQLDYAVDAGVNFIDTAELYPVPPRQQTQGLTETYLGHWLKQRKGRDKLIIASKVCGKADWIPYMRDGKACLDRNNITAALDASLQRLQTDYIDLYQLHWPDRDASYFGRLDYHHAPEKDGVSLEETLHVLGDLVQAGKIRMIGLSNETPWGVATCLLLSERHALPRIVSVQNPYNLLNRSFEIGLSEFAHRDMVGLIAYSPLGFGVLSGKYLKGAKPAGARLSLFDRFTRYTGERGIQATAAYIDLARQHGLDAAQMALAFVNTRPFVTTNLIGATTMEQLQSNITSLDIVLSREVEQALANIHDGAPNPCP